MVVGQGFQARLPLVTASLVSPQVGELGTYYTVSFDWRERESEAEIKQLDLIAAFLSSYKDQLIDLEGTRDMTCVDGWKAQQLQTLTAGQPQLEGSSNPSLPATK